MDFGQDTTGPFMQLFFILIVMVGAFFIVNLVTAVLVMRFSHVKEMQDKVHTPHRLSALDPSFSASAFCFFLFLLCVCVC